MAKKLYVLILSLAVFSCRPEKTAKAISNNAYFDLKGYFEKEVERYNAKKPTVEKTVAINGKAEIKRLVIKDWQRELAIFTDADINKSAWQGAFTIEKSGSDTHYTSENKKIPVKEVFISNKFGKVAKVEVIIANVNLLYHSNDTLTYYPDSLYQIVKQQKIKLMGVKRYKIVGKIR
ncbi:hypothetical protein ABIB40_002973 [Pedobacter sp. UYP30]|uniref:hypothetical protein n=1 Tax=Pedobacter sp. UYP30 TaxID=1756400 RepID=UPI003392A1E2